MLATEVWPRFVLVLGLGLGLVLGLGLGDSANVSVFKC